MILQPCNVELTKIHYYDQRKWERHFQVPSISREISQNEFNKNLIIKKNIFGHRWVLKINEQNGSEKKEQSKLKLVVYVLVFSSIVVAVAFGAYFSLDKMFENKEMNKTKTIVFRPTNKNGINFTSRLPNNRTFKNQSTHEKQITVPPDLLQENNTTTLNTSSISKTVSSSASHKIYCQECQKDSEVCIKLSENEVPKCVEKIDNKDPTGCGGLCKINTEFCQLLDRNNCVYQCFSLKHLLKCPNDTFNCGNMCIAEEKRCDGVINCSNKSDENKCDCNLRTHFQCGNSTSCLENSRKCNGIVDCWDKTDELDCEIMKPCNENYLPCLNGECIKKEKFCDKSFDCGDRSDEPIWCQEIII